MGECLVLDMLHHHEVDAVLAADNDKRAYVGVIQTRYRPSELRKVTQTLLLLATRSGPSRFHADDYHRDFALNRRRGSRCPG